MPKILTFSNIEFGALHLYPIFDDTGKIVDFELRAEAALKEDITGILVNRDHHTIPLSDVEKAQIITWIKNVARPKVVTLLGL